MSKTRKSSILVLLCVSLILALCGMFSITNANADAIPDETKFNMLPGCSVRISGTNEGNGIRFSADADKVWYDELVSKGNTLTAGTFIMPFDYIEKNGAINEENCFGANAVYKWKDKENVTTETKTIIHMESAPHIKSLAGGSEVYRVNGSVVNMLDQNLAREYVGVCYIKAVNGENISYYFANSDFNANHRSIIGVSQNILLKGDGDEQTNNTANAYLNKYIEVASPTRTYTEEYYVNCSTGYEVKETKENVVTIDTVDKFINDIGNDAPTLDGYKYRAKISTPKTKLALDNSAKVQYYFDKDLGGTIFDSKDIVTAGEPIEANKQIVTTGDNEYQLIPAGAAPNMFAISNVWGYSSEKSLYCHTNSNGWHRILFTNEVVFPYPTDTISMIIKNVKVTEDRNLDIETDPYATGYITLKANQTEPYRVEIKLTKPISSFKDMEIWAADHASGNDVAFLMDDIKPVYKLDVKESVIKLTKENATGSHTMNIGDVLISNVYSDRELSTGMTVTYKNLSTGAESNLPIENGNITYVTEPDTSYSITLTGNIGGSEVKTDIKVLGYYEDFVTDFDNNDFSINNPVLAEVKNGSFDGSNAFYIKPGGSKDWAHFIPSSPYVLKSECTKLCLWMYSPTDFTQNTGIVPSWIYPGSFYVPSGENLDGVTHFYEGWHYYEIDLGKTLKASSTLVNIQFYVEFTGHIMIDYIALK